MKADTGLKTWISLGLKWLCVALFCFIPLFSSCTSAINQKRAPDAKTGILDLKGWDFLDYGSVELVGEWQFYWKELYTPDDFKGALKPVQTGLMKLPRLWNGYQVRDAKLGGHGFATFRLKVAMPPGNRVLAVKATDMATAYRLWVNDELVLSNGVVGKSEVSMKPQFYPKFSSIHSHSDMLVFTLQVSNFHHRKGGVWTPLVLGNERQIIQDRESAISLEMFFFGCMMMMSIYHAGLFLLRKKDPSPLYLGLVCFLAGMRSTLVGERFLVRQFPDFSWEIFHKLEYITFYLAIPFFGFFLVSLFPEFTKKAGRFVMVVACLFTLFTLVTPARINSHGLMIYQIFLFCLSLYAFWIFYRIFKNNWEGAGWIATGVAILLIAVFVDILAVNGWLPTVNISPLGLFIFIFFQSMMLSIRFYKAFTSYEIVTRSLTRTNRQKNELVNALKENEKKYRELVENMDDVVFTANLQGLFDYVSPVIEKVLKYQPDKLVGTAITDYIYPSSIDESNKLMDEAGKGHSKQAEVRFYLRSGELRWVRLKVRPLYDLKGVSGFQGFLADVTEAKKTRELMIQTEKMVSVGGLAGGMAHELNNPLAAITQATQNISRRLTTTIKPNLEAAEKTNIDLDNLKDYLEERQILRHLANIKTSGERAAEIIRNMLQFSRKSDAKKNYVSLSEILDNAVKLASSDYDLKKDYDFRRVKIIKEYEKSLPPVNCNRTEIEQVIFNLIKNAGQAMSGESINGNPQIVIKLTSDEKSVRIEIVDNGPGMDESHRKRAFEPFFTTKSEGMGTGLGLSVSHTIITQNHKGTIELESEPGSGTRFIIHLPLEPGD